MPKNTKGGNKTKKLKNSNDFNKIKETPLPLESENSHVAEIISVLGGYRFKCKIITEN